MGFNLGEILAVALPVQGEQIKKGQVYAIKTKAFYLKTNIKLYNQDDSERKSRPIIIIDKDQDVIKFIALSTTPSYNLKTGKYRKRISLENCKFEGDGFCANIKIKKEAYIFVRDNRDRFYINEKIFKDLKSNREAKLCGKCENFGGKTNWILQIKYTIF